MQQLQPFQPFRHNEALHTTTKEASVGARPYRLWTRPTSQNKKRTILVTIHRKVAY
jgi:hypothetical protein